MINCLDGERHLKSAIFSLLSQTKPPQEVIFVDNGSDDNSLIIAKSLLPSEITKFVEIKKGNTVCLGEARQIALDQVKSDYVAFLDVDDVWLPNKLECQVALLDKFNIGLVYSSYEVISEYGRTIGTRRLLDGFPSIHGLLLRYDINMSSVALNVKKLKEHNLTFNVELKYCPDFELFLRVAAILDCYRDSRILVKYRKSETSLTKKLSKVRGREVRQAITLILHAIKHSPKLATPAKRLMVRICVCLLVLKSISYDIQK